MTASVYEPELQLDPLTFDELGGEWDNEVYAGPSWQKTDQVVDPADYQEEDLRDFRNFMWLCLQHLLQVEPTPLQYEVAAEIQNGPPRQIICGFRGLSKSWICAIYVAYLLYWYPKENILVLSAGKERAAQFTYMILGLLRDIPQLQWLYPTRNQRQSGLTFDVAPAGSGTQMPSVKAAGIFSAVTGFRGGFVVGDDIEIPENSDTVGKRLKLQTKMDEVVTAILKPTQHGKVLPYTIQRPRAVLLGTPQSEQSVYTTLEKEHKFEFTVWPVEFPEAEDYAYFGNRLAPSIRKRIEEEGVDACAGLPVDPWRFPEEVIAEKKEGTTKLMWKLQFQLSTRLSDAERYPLKLRDFIVMDLHDDVAPQQVVWSGSPEYTIPEKELPVVGLMGDAWQNPQKVDDGKWLPYTAKILYIDPSGRGKDETAWGVLGTLNGNFFLLEQGGFLMGYDDVTLKAIAQIAKRHRVNVVAYEDNFGDGMFGSLLFPHLKATHPCQLEGIHATKQKEKRIIESLEGPMTSHRLIINRRCIQDDMLAGTDALTDEPHTYRLFFQLTHITYEKGCLPHDDRADGLGHGVRFLQELLHQDPAEKAQEWKKEQEERWFGPDDEDEWEDLQKSLKGSSRRRSRIDGDTWSQNSKESARPRSSFNGVPRRGER